MADDAQAAFDAAFAQAAVKRPKTIDPNMPLPHYPQKRYIEKNLAPEQTLTYGDVGDLAAARQLAESTGVLPKEVGDYMLPMAMVEGRPGNFGINDGNGFRASDATLARAKKLGLGITDLTDPATAEKHQFDFHEDDAAAGTRAYYRRITIQGPNGPQEAHLVVDGPPTTPLVIDYAKGKTKGVSTVGLSAAGVMEQAAPAPARIPGNRMLNVNGSGAPGDMAKLMALILAEKHAAAGGDAAGTIRGYNGAGPATEKYLQKVEEARALLAHPRNAPLLAHYNSVYLKKK